VGVHGGGGKREEMRECEFMHVCIPSKEVRQAQQVEGGGDRERSK